MDPIKINIPRVLTFTKVNSSKLNNSLHVQYHRKQYELVMDVDHTKLKFPAGLPEAWNTANPVTTTATTYTSPQSEP